MNRYQRIIDVGTTHSFMMLRWPDNDLSPGLVPAVCTGDYERGPESPTNEDLIEIAFGLCAEPESPAQLHSNLVRFLQKPSRFVQCTGHELANGWLVEVKVMPQ